MKFNKFASAVAISLALASGAATASPFYINVGSIPGAVLPGGTDGITALIYQLGVNWGATSNYTDSGALNGILDTGDTVLDSGFGSVNGYLNKFGVAYVGDENIEGQGSKNQIIFSYDNLLGDVVFNNGTGGILAHYTSGDIHVYNNANLGDGTVDAGDTEILTLKVFDSTANGVNAILSARVTYADPGTWLFPPLPGTDWSDFIVNIAINARIDTNVDGPIPDPSNPQTTPATWSRFSTLNGSVQFVPEPGSLALVGLGLLGLSLSRRNKKTV